jgi:hypothetical protein
MMCDRDNLETERQHVGYKARLDDLGRINALFLEMREAFLEEAPDRTEESAGSLRRLRRRAKRPWRRFPITLCVDARCGLFGFR